MLKKLVIIIAVFVVFISQNVFAGGSLEQEKKTLTLKFSALLGLEVSQIKASPINNIVEVFTNQGLFYASKDGNFLFHGKLFGINQRVVDLSEASLGAIRIDGMKKFNKNMVIYPAKNEKHVITVFTDITCGYCRKLHNQMDEYNNKGITVRYLAYPRSGVKNALGELTANFKNMRSVWCNEDPKKAMSTAFAGGNVPYRICDMKVAEEFDFGRQVGVNGTPAIMLENGMMLPGYRDPASMLQVLNGLN